MTSPLYQRAVLFLSHQRYPEAEKEIRSHLAMLPDDVEAMHLLAEILQLSGQYEKAEHVVRDCISRDPGRDAFYFTYARVLIKLDKEDDALIHLQRAVEINPGVADYFSVWAAILFDKKEFKKALELADHGLQLDAESLSCLNIRSQTLIRLGRKKEAFETIRKALERDPSNAYTHCNYGWSELEKGDHVKALEHFRESLRIDPGFQQAKAGMVEALKARYWFYRMYLRYAFWMSNLKGNARWGMIIGLYIAFRLLKFVADEFPALQPVAIPLIVLYIAFAFSSWIIEPLTNLFLRINPYGRYALLPEETKASTWVGISLSLALIGAVVYLITGYEPWAALAILGFTAMLPLGSMWTPKKTAPRKWLTYYSVGLVSTGAVAVLVSLANGEAVNVISMVYLIGFAAYQWVANWVISNK